VDKFGGRTMTSWHGIFYFSGNINNGATCDSRV